MGHSTLERQIMHARRGVSEAEGDGLEFAQGRLDRLERKYIAEGNVLADMGKAEFNEAWRQIVDGECNYVRVYSPGLDDEIVLSRFGQLDWEDKTKVYSEDEIRMLKGTDEAMLKMVHLVKSEIPGCEVVEVRLDETSDTSD